MRISILFEQIYYGRYGYEIYDYNDRPFILYSDDSVNFKFVSIYVIIEDILKLPNIFLMTLLNDYRFVLKDVSVWFDVLSSFVTERFFSGFRAILHFAQPMKKYLEFYMSYYLSKQESNHRRWYLVEFSKRY